MAATIEELKSWAKAQTTKQEKQSAELSPYQKNLQDPTFYPHWVEIKKVSIYRYLALYPNLTIEEINQEAKNFFDNMIRFGPLNESSKSYNHYQRGWISKANHIAGQK